MKQTVLNSAIGSLALAARDSFDLLRIALSRPESLGTLANDQLATRIITRICQPEKTFIDVGAHIGSVIAEVRRQDPTIKLIAIEAIPEKANNLRRKCSYAEIIECAVGESESEVSFFVHQLIGICFLFISY